MSCCKNMDHHKRHLDPVASHNHAVALEALHPFALMYATGFKGTVFEGKADHETIFILNEGKVDEMKITMGDFHLAFSLVTERSH